MESPDASTQYGSGDDDPRQVTGNQDLPIHRLGVRDDKIGTGVKKRAIASYPITLKLHFAKAKVVGFAIA